MASSNTRDITAHNGLTTLPYRALQAAARVVGGIKLNASKDALAAHLAANGYSARDRTLVPPATPRALPDGWVSQDDPRVADPAPVEAPAPFGLGMVPGRPVDLTGLPENPALGLADLNAGNGLPPCEAPDGSYDPAPVGAPAPAVEAPAAPAPQQQGPALAPAGTLAVGTEFWWAGRADLDPRGGAPWVVRRHLADGGLLASPAGATHDGMDTFVYSDEPVLPTPAPAQDADPYGNPPGYLAEVDAACAATHAHNDRVIAAALGDPAPTPVYSPAPLLAPATKDRGRPAPAMLGRHGTTAPAYALGLEPGRVTVLRLPPAPQDAPAPAAAPRTTPAPGNALAPARPRGMDAAGKARGWAPARWLRPARPNRAQRRAGSR